MLTLRLSSPFTLIAVIGLIGLLQLFSTANAEYPGVIELVGYSNRRARTHYMPNVEDNPPSAPAPAKFQADIETVKANIEKYNKLLTLDTKNLPESQKDMLERIVERVARLKESLDIDEDGRLIAAKKLLGTQSYTAAAAAATTSALAEDEANSEDIAGEIAKTTSLTTEMAAVATNVDNEAAEEAETDATVIQDETTLLQQAHTVAKDELAGETGQTAAMAHDLPAITTTEYSFNRENDGEAEQTERGTDSAEIEDATESLMTAASDGASSPPIDYLSTTMDPLTEATDADDQFVAARSNNRIAAASIKAEPEEPSNGHTTLGSQRTLTTSGAKLTKTRATKRPGGITKGGGSAVKRGQKPNTNAGLHRQTATNRQKLVTSTTTTTTQPAQNYQKQLLKQQQQQLLLKQQQQLLKQQQMQQTASSPTYQQTHNNNNKVYVSSPTPLATDKSSPPAVSAASAAATATAASSPISSASSPASPASASSYSSTPLTTTTTLANNYGSMATNNDMDYEPQVNTSALIDSLNAREEFFQQKQAMNNNKDKKPSATAKPTKYHYYPHNQHIYLLPECAIQQVCNAVYVRLNYTQPLCACPSRYRDPCSASLNEDDQHTTKLVGDSKKKAITLAKTCEATTEMRECSSPKDWSLLALQNIRTGKSHYLIICRCPDHFKMEGPMAHDQPKYASVPGIRVFGMMCVKPGYSVRKPSSQPPKRYQLQKPFYRPSSQSNNAAYINVPQYGTKDTYGRPSSSSSSSAFTSASAAISSNNYLTDNGFTNQHQTGGYQYLNRPDSINNINPHQSLSMGNYRPDTLTSINNFQTGIYGRNNERKGDTPIEAIKDEEKTPSMIITSTQQSAETMTAASAAAAAGIEETTANVNFNGDFAASALQKQQQQDVAELRQKRSLDDEEANALDNDVMPEFPWDRAMDFQQTIIWD